MSWCFHRGYPSPNDWLSIYFCYDKKLFCQVFMHSKILAKLSKLSQVRTVDGWNRKTNNLKKKTWKTWRKETQKNLERSWQQVVCIVWGSKFSQVWILGYVWYTSYLLTWMLHNVGKWMASKKQIETRKMTQKNSKVPKHVTLLIFLLLLCCSLYLPLSTYFVWRVADAVKEA